MPKRILDDSFLDSRSMEVLSPGAQDAFPRFILIADDFGCFEVNPRILHARGWSRRPDVTEEMVAGWIVEYAERQAQDPDTGEKLAPVLMLWTHVGRRYAYLTGWHGPHGQKKRVEYDPATAAGLKGSKRKTPAPPSDLLAAVMAGNVRSIDGKPPGTDRIPTGNPDEEIPSLSVPAREIAGKLPGDDREAAGKSTVPVPAVPVAVPVAAAAGRAAAAPSDFPARRLEVVDEGGGDPRSDPYPLTARFRADLAASLARTAPHPVGGGDPVFKSCEAALERIPVAEAVALCAARVRDDVTNRRNPPKTLALFVQVLGDELTRRASQPKAARKCVGMDGEGQPIWETA